MGPVLARYFSSLLKEYFQSNNFSALRNYLRATSRKVIAICAVYCQKYELAYFGAEFISEFVFLGSR